MKSIISEPWNGKIASCEHCGARDREAITLFTKVRQGREVLEAMLSEEQQSSMEQYSQDWEDYLLRMMELSFREGMVLGIRLGAEVFSVSE